MDGRAETDEGILNFDVPHEALESELRASNSEQSLGCIALTHGITASGHSSIQASLSPTIIAPLAPVAWRCCWRSFAPHLC
jgi:hypothetical protein